MIVAAWEWLDSPTSFKLYFGIDLEKAESLRSDNESINIACFWDILVGRLVNWKVNWSKIRGLFLLLIMIYFLKWTKKGETWRNWSVGWVTI